jgi:hypothetical protein
VPQLVIVDGQQRLTSLYAIVKGMPVVRENYDSEKICIAFNPLEERFEVSDAAIARDKSFIPDISNIWSSSANIFKVANEYLNNLQRSREVSDEEVEKIQNAITKLQGLLTFPFTALELSSDISEEDVAEVFVRINSKGTSLNQADFILTVMSVFWDEGRSDLEHFCKDTRKPTKGKASPFNYFIEPDPDQLLRVSVGLAFKRAKLKYVYSILRGKDLETEEFSEERRIEQFNILKNSQSRVLNVQYWHDFLSCIRMAGFRSNKMISSQTNLLFSYILYLIGRTEIGVDEFTLRKSIAQWFFMSAVTGRFTSSPESKMEFDLIRLRDVKTADEFLTRLNAICEVTLTTDFWNVTLPNDLATSSSRSPSLFAYNAALVLLDANVLFSKVKMAEMLDPALHANRSSLERHHLFPKAYLNKIGYSSTRDTNQIANYAYVEWMDNVKIGETPPSEYLNEMEKRFTEGELSRQYHFHALPQKWWDMDYQEFLQKRRELMSQIIREGYEILTSQIKIFYKKDKFDLSSIINQGESEVVEFRQTLRTNKHTGEVDSRIEMSILSILAGFLNNNGGTLIVGLSDDGYPTNLRDDNFANEDEMSLYLVDLVKERMGSQALLSIHVNFDDYNGNRIMLVRCTRAQVPIFVEDVDVKRFFIRTGSLTIELDAEQIEEYLARRESFAKT